MSSNNIYNNPVAARLIILDHYENPNNFIKDKTKLANYKTANIASSSCIDNVTSYILIKNNKIIDIKFSGVGCAICTSSTDIMASILKNKTINEAKKIIKNYLNMIDAKPYDPKILKELIVYQNVNKQVNRINCAKIGIQTILKALNEYEN